MKAVSIIENHIAGQRITVCDKLGTDDADKTNPSAISLQTSTLSIRLESEEAERKSGT